MRTDILNDILIYFNSIENGKYTIDNLQYLNHGSQSVIYKIKLNNNKCIMKIFYNSIFQNSFFEMEKTSLQKLTNSNISPNFIDSKIINIDGIMYYVIFMEYFEHFVQYDKFCYDNSFTHSYDTFIKFYKNILTCLKNFSEYVIHRDIKPDNIMILNKDMDTIRIIDYGLGFTYNISPFKYISCTSMALQYQCPDYIIRSILNENIYVNEISHSYNDEIYQIGRKNDIFSTLVMMYYDFEKTPLFKIKGIFPDYYTILQNKEGFFNTNSQNQIIGIGKNYYPILKKYILSKIIFIQNNNNISIKINELLEYFINNMDLSYDLLIDYIFNKLSE